MAKGGPSGKLKSEKMTVVAELELTHPGGKEIVRSFDTSWHRMLEIAKTSTPVRCKLNGFVRKTEKEMEGPL
jgi:hypothetical protein